MPSQRVIFHLILSSLSAGSLTRADDEFERPPIEYSKGTPTDAVAQLAKQQLKWSRGDSHTLLRELMERLHVPEASQVLVFSKTSKQNDLISPSSPRAIWFGDDAYIGYASGGLIEIAAMDPKLGPVFYTVDPHDDEAQPLSFTRDQSCMSCHGGPFTDGSPGVMVRSVTPSATGHPIFSQGSTVVDTSTPFSKRWGGWYVTGRHGSVAHRGNTIGTEKDEQVIFDTTAGQNITDLSLFFDSSRYLRGSSDIVALMILEHQTSTQNVLVKVNHSVLRAMEMQHALAKELAEPVSALPTGSAKRIVDHGAQDVLDALLFKDEAALPEGGIEGSTDFVEQFTTQSPRSRDGRSLKDLQCLERLFKYRCSYVIYGTSFKGLHPGLRSAVLVRLKAALGGRDERYSYLGATEREHIRQILAETLPGLELFQ
jgi:hypothetical protein